jgi:hypothetical protein
VRALSADAALRTLAASSTTSARGLWRLALVDREAGLVFPALDGSREARHHHIVPTPPTGPVHLTLAGADAALV